MAAGGERAATFVNGRDTLAAGAPVDLTAEARKWRLPNEPAQAAAERTLRALLDAVDADASIPDQLAVYVNRRCGDLLG